MWFRGKVNRLTLVLTVFAMSLCVNGADQKSGGQKSKDKKVSVEGTPILWREPADIASLNLLLGPGGEEMKPDTSKVTFISEEQGGYSKKYRVHDGSGRVWVAKLSKEAQAETAATRLLWAAGYFTDITYLVPRVVIEGKGTFENVRFEARPKNIKRLDEWRWDHNPFTGTKEFQGLKTLMVLLDNWDIKDSNNRILQVRTEGGEVELRYIVSDLGATLGKTGGFASRTRNKPSDFANARFIDGVKRGHVNFHYSGKRQDVFEDITIDQARWIGEVLARLSDEQISDAFRAANYGPEEVQMLTRAVRGRINQLVGLPQTMTGRPGGAVGADSKQ